MSASPEWPEWSDTQAADQIFELLGLVRKERQMALLVVTHDPRLAPTVSSN
jgi:ABC-type lipoprotein export system ATPase subunit